MSLTRRSHPRVDPRRRRPGGSTDHPGWSPATAVGVRASDARRLAATSAAHLAAHPNRHVLVSQVTATGTAPVSDFYLSWHLLLRGVQLEQIRGDRVPHEARADPLHLTAVFARAAGPGSPRGSETGQSVRTGRDQACWQPKTVGFVLRQFIQTDPRRRQQRDISTCDASTVWSMRGRCVVAAERGRSEGRRGRAVHNIVSC